MTVLGGMRWLAGCVRGAGRCCMHANEGTCEGEWEDESARPPDQNIWRKRLAFGVNIYNIKIRFMVPLVWIQTIAFCRRLRDNLYMSVCVCVCVCVCVSLYIPDISWSG